MTSASYSSQAKSTRSISKSGRWVSRCPRDRALRLQFKARILRDREQPGRFGALLGSLTTTRPIVPQNYSPARIRFLAEQAKNGSQGAIHDGLFPKRHRPPRSGRSWRCDDPKPITQDSLAARIRDLLDARAMTATSSSIGPSTG